MSTLTSHLALVLKAPQSPQRRQSLRTSMVENIADLFPDDPGIRKLETLMRLDGGMRATNFRNVIGNTHKEITGENPKKVPPMLQNASVLATRLYQEAQSLDTLRAGEPVNRLDINKAGEMVCGSMQMAQFLKQSILSEFVYHKAPIDALLTAIQSKPLAEIQGGQSALGLIPGSDLYLDQKPQFLEVIAGKVQHNLFAWEVRFQQIEARRAIELGLQNIEARTEDEILQLMKNVVRAAEADHETVQLLQDNTRIVAEAAEAAGALHYMPSDAVFPIQFQGQIVRDTIRYASLKRLGLAGLSSRQAKILKKDGSLSEHDRRQMWSHPDIALDILDEIACDNETAKAIAGGRWAWDGTHAHYEQNGNFVDGTYPPSPLHHADIHPAARIVEAVDAFRALTSPNPLRDREALPFQTGIAKFKALSGNLLDPAVVEIVMRELEKGLLKTHSQAKMAA